MTYKNLVSVAVIVLVLFGAVLSCGNGVNKISETEMPPVEEIIGYESHIKPIINNYCLTCHSEPDPVARLNLSTYERVRKMAEFGPLLERINDADDPMPQRGLMPKYERELIKKWAENGFERKGKKKEKSTDNVQYEFAPEKIDVVDIGDEIGIEFLEKMSGHFVGKMELMGQNIPWFAFDFRPIGSAHVHGIFEGGSMGNLFTSFFIANYKGKKTLMVRNGGILSEFYRTSYFILDKVEKKKGEEYYRFVDAYGGKDIMYIEVAFKGDKIDFKSYTSRFGTYPEPKLHMDFEGKNLHPALSEMAAKEVNFPQNEVQFDFSDGLPTADWGKEYPVTTSASYMWQDLSADLVTMGKLSGDPIHIDQMPYLSQLTLEFNRKDLSKGKRINFYLSTEPLTDENGKFTIEFNYIKLPDFNTVVLFPEVTANEDEFTLTYLHPGKYYITAMVDVDGNLSPTKGDYSSISQEVIVKPNSKTTIQVNAIDVKN